MQKQNYRNDLIRRKQDAKQIEVWAPQENPADNDFDAQEDAIIATAKESSGPTEFTSLDEKRHIERLYSGLTTADSKNVTPIEQRLKTPSALRVKLLEHQKLGLEWMLKCENGINRGGILADDMVFVLFDMQGLGKTIQSIALILSNKPEEQGHPTLIVAPVRYIHSPFL